MNIDISKILHKKGASVIFDVTESIGSGESLLDDIFFDGPVTVSGEVTNIGDVFEVKGNAKAKVMMACARCTKAVTTDITFDFHERYSNSVNEDDEIHHFEGGIVDLDEMLLSETVIHLPMRLVCEDESVCSPLRVNSQEVDEDKDNSEQVDPRFAKLMGLKFED